MITIATINRRKLMQNASQCIETVNHIVSKTTIICEKKTRNKTKTREISEKGESVKYDKKLKVTFRICMGPV